MVVKMMKWSPWPPVPTISKKFQVKVKPIKLELGGLFINGFEANNNKEEDVKKKEEKEEEEKVVMVEMKWKGPKIGLPGLRRASNRGRNVSSERILCDIIEWGDGYNDEFERVLKFQKDNSPSFNPWDVSFNLLCGQKGDVRNKFVVIGKVPLNIAELASQMEAQIERKLPISVQVAGVSSQASLLISVSFVEIRNDSVEIVQEAASVSDRDDGFLRRVLSRTRSKKKNKKIEKMETEETNEESGSKPELVELDESTLFDSDGSPDNSVVSTQPESVESNPVANKEEDDSSLVCCSESDKEASSVSQLGQSPSPEMNRLDSVSKIGFWKKRKLSFRSLKKKDEKIAADNAEVDSKLNKITNETSTSKNRKQELSIGNWEEQELISRDGRTKLKANIFAASIDQRSEKAAGESACTALVALIANWLQINPEKMPTLSEFDNLITEGSSEWRKLCDNEGYITRFPDKHFDLETILEAKLRPLSVNPDKSFIGFFCPESFESLKGAMSFDAMWEEISNTTTNHIDDDLERDKQPQVYIVSWNDHFFVLKVESDTYYVIDTLGERLFEGCNQAYILKFDKDAIVYDLSKKADENAAGTKDQAEMSSTEEGKEMRIWKGKECCREFIKRFLAAIPLRELEVEEKKGTLATITLHQRLQIEFHFSTTPSTSPSSLPSSCD